MTREEFLNTLREKLAALPAEERDDAVKYYNEYFDEAENEQQAIDELGDIQRVANVIIANSPSYQSAQYDASGENEPLHNKQKQAPPKYDAYEYSGTASVKNAHTAKLVVFIILCIIFVPAIFSIAIGIVSAVFGILFGIAGGCIALVASAVVCIASSVTLLGTDIASGLATLGIGLVCAAAGIIIGRAVVLVGIRFIPKICHFFKFAFYKIKERAAMYL